MRLDILKPSNLVKSEIWNGKFDIIWSIFDSWDGFGEVDASEHGLGVEVDDVKHFLKFFLIIRENLLIQRLDSSKQLSLFIFDFPAAVELLSKITCIIIHLLFVVVLEFLDTFINDLSEFLRLIYKLVNSG